MLPAEIVVCNVPIFCPHQNRECDGRLIVVDNQRLRRVAANTAMRAGRGGLRLLLGHSAGPGQHPPLVGRASDLAVGAFGPSRQLAILATFRYSRDAWEEAKKYPFRSVEFYPDRDEITAVSLLKTDPILDLGMLTFGSDEELVRYGNPAMVATPDRHEQAMQYMRSIPGLRYEDALHAVSGPAWWVEGRGRPAW